MKREVVHQPISSRGVPDTPHYSGNIDFAEAQRHEDANCAQRPREASICLSEITAPMVPPFSLEYGVGHLAGTTKQDFVL